MSRLVPSRRYRCRSVACKWEGNLRDALYELPPADVEKRYDRRIDWERIGREISENPQWLGRELPAIFLEVDCGQSFFLSSARPSRRVA